MARGPGTILKAMIRDWLKVHDEGCGGCKKLLEQMDAWGPDGCRQRIGRIVPQIRRNAKKNKNWLAIIGSRIPGVRWPIYGMVLLAIRASETELAAERTEPTDKPKETAP